MTRMRMAPPERYKRLSGASQTHKPWTSIQGHHKRYSGRPDLQPHDRKKFRDMETSPQGKATSADYSKFDPDDDTFYDSDVNDPSKTELDSDEDNEDTLFTWEDEDTLYSDLLDAPSEPEDLDELLEGLQPAFDERGRELKREIAETLVPTVNRVKSLYEKIATDVDGTFAKGIIGFNNACKELEALCMRDEDELKDAWARLQRGNKQLFAQLKEAYAARDRLWAEYDKAANETVHPMLESLRDLPGNVERTIGNLEKQARILEKDEVNAASAVEKKIKGFLSKA